MKTNKLLILAALVMVLAACGAGSKKSNDMEKRTQVKIETTMGDIVVELYNETPKHRDNFIKLAKEGVYDSTLFHRVIKAFMIQAGDPDSKNANDTAQLGSGDVGYTVPAEFVSKFFHKKGALAAARMGDDVNPERASSGCQFYIVTGRKFREAQLSLSLMFQMPFQVSASHQSQDRQVLRIHHRKSWYKVIFLMGIRHFQTD